MKAAHLVLAALVGLWCIVLSAEVQGQGDPREARDLYNEGRIDAAIEGAEAALEETHTAAAALVLARARLERYRRFEILADLTAARRLLDKIDAERLAPRALVDWKVGVATSLFYNDRPGPASVIFERLIDEPLLSSDERDSVLDWWATALDRVGRVMTKADRARIYGIMGRRLDDEVDGSSSSSPASYWSVVAAWGSGDPERAWDLAVVAWVSAPLAGSDRSRLRIDLDRLVLQGVIPDVAVLRTGEPADQVYTVRTMATLAAEWEELKTFWTGDTDYEG